MKLNILILLDLISLFFLLTVRLITLAVLVFSCSYINNDKFFLRFHLLLITFVLRIYLLILRPNILRLLLGWDGLGLRSYLLVIYYGNRKAYNSGFITAMRNRVGDILILFRIRIFLILGTWDTIVLRTNKIIILPILICVAACTKRAQIPFRAWLPAAIAAPTPVSSLVHSSTLVTAGVYLLIRFYNFLFLNQRLNYLLFIGIITTLMASLAAFFESDIKK